MSYISLYALGRMPLAWMPASTAYIITCLLCGPSSGGRTPFALNRSIFILPLGVYQDARGGTVKTQTETDRQTRAAPADRRHPHALLLPLSSFPVPVRPKGKGARLLRAKRRAVRLRARARARNRPAPRASQSSLTHEEVRMLAAVLLSSQVKSSLYVNNRQRIWLFFIPMDTKIGDSTERI
jgi:hypothetical protein